jgi:hypothetical protein
MTFAYPRCAAIRVDDYSKPYRNEVVRYLDLIATTDVGRTLYTFMARSSKTVFVTWSPGADWMDTGVSTISSAHARRLLPVAQRIARERHIDLMAAFEAAFNEDPALKKKRMGEYAKGHPVMQNLHIDILARLGLPSDFLVPTNETGTGEGADVQLDYHPAAFRQLVKTTGTIGVGFGPGEALFHELVHALRAMTGVELAENVIERWDMDGFEEFCSIVAANIYRSARGFRQLRFDHRIGPATSPWRDNTPLSAELADSRRYYERFKPQIVKWFANQRDFCAALASSRAPFNPMAVAADDLGVPYVRG